MTTLIFIFSCFIIHSSYQPYFSFYSYHVNETINIMLWPIIVIQYHFTGGIQHFLILHQMTFTISSLLHLLHWQRMRKHTEKNQQYKSATSITLNFSNVFSIFL